MCEISIILPVYNKARYVLNVLTDIEKQSFSDYECIIIDDGSTDLSGKICDDFAAGDRRFFVYHTTNGGVSHARNLGLEKSRGKYLTFVDADDRIEKDYLQELHNDIMSSGADMVIAAPLKFWSDGRPHVRIHVPYVGVQSHDRWMEEFATVQKNTGIYGFSCGKLLPRELVGNIRFSEKICLAEDFDFFLRIYPQLNNLYFEPSHKYFYLQEADNSSAIVDNADIDYVTQLKINLAYRRFLQQSGFYSGDNQKIVDGRVSDYAFFSILYCKRDEIPDTVKTINSLLLESKFHTKGSSPMESVILFCINNDFRRSPRIIMAIYDILRRIKRRL